MKMLKYVRWGATLWLFLLVVHLLSWALFGKGVLNASDGGEAATGLLTLIAGFCFFPWQVQ